MTNNPDRGCTLTFTEGVDRVRHATDSESPGKAAGQPETTLTTSGSEPLRILLAEDNHVNQLVTVKMLNKRGHSVRVVSDGNQAIRAFQEEPFDVILMDVQMPELDGYEASAAIRQLEAGRSTRVPIIALTAHAIKGVRETCVEAGMDSYVPKPIRMADLMAELNAVREIPVLAD